MRYYILIHDSINYINDKFRYLTIIDKFAKQIAVEYCNIKKYFLDEINFIIKFSNGNILIEIPQDDALYLSRIWLYKRYSDQEFIFKNNELYFGDKLVCSNENIFMNIVNREIS